MLENDLNVFSAYDSRSSAGISLLVGRSLDADVNVVFTGDECRLVVVYAPNTHVERVSFFYRLASLNG